MLADINTAPGQPDSSSPGSFARRGDALYFAASSPLVGRELFVADRATGVRLVLDLVPGTSDANPTDLLAWGSGLVFLADLGTGHRPHFYDLTTRTLRNLMNRPGRASGVSALTVSGGRLFFAANDGVGGADLWVAASPDSQAQPVADIRVDGAATFAAMLPFGSGVAMVVDDGVHGYELWLSDGTASGTRLVRDLNPGSAWGAYNIPPVVFGGEVYFVGDDGATGGELYASDGNNLRLVADLVSGPSGSFPKPLLVAGNRLAFLAGDLLTRRLVVSDGTAAGTQFIPALGDLESLVADDTGRLWGMLRGAMRDVVVVDRGTTTVRRVGLSLPPGSLSTPIFATAGSRLYFEANSPSSLRAQLWTSDGTAAGSGPLVGALLGSSVFAIGYADGGMFAVLGTENEGRELWLSDGTAAGTRLFADLDPTRRSLGSNPIALGEIGGRVVMTAVTENGRQLVASDGSPRGTAVLRSAGSRSGWRVVAHLNDALVLSELDNGDRLLRTDGTPGGTSVLASVAAVSIDSSTPAGVALDGARAVFAGSTDGLRVDLWVTDGSAAGTRLLRTIDPNGSAPFGFVKVGARAWFFATDGSSPVALWASDGTAAGTVSLTTVPQFNRQRMLGVVGDKVVFAANDGQTGIEPWVSDGTAAGTRLLADLTVGGSTIFAVGTSTSLDGRLLMRAGRFVVATDGTPLGTIRLPGVDGSEAIVGMGDVAYLVRTDALSPAFLRTDGTAAGTVALPVPLPAGRAELQRVSDGLFTIGIVPAEGAIGRLLVSDGSFLGTRVLAENYFAGAVGVVDGGVVHAGFDGSHGVEPWFSAVGAMSRVVGLGCGRVAVPTLRASEPRLGQQLVLRGVHAGLASAVLFGAPAFTPVRLPLPTSGCALFVDAIAVSLSLPSQGELRLPVPFGVDLVGGRLAAQLVSVDATPALSLSNGVRLTIGQ